jgi:membrane-bound lytic murein transglycosylase B
VTGPDPTEQNTPTTLTVREPGPGEHQPRHAAPVTVRTSVLRRVPPALGRGVARVAMAGLQSLWRVSAWRRGPVGGFVAPLLVLVVVLGIAGVAGATLPQRHVGPPVAAASSQPVPTPATTAPTPQTGEDDLLPSDAPSSDDPRPVDGLAAWAQRLSTVVGVSATALQAYGNAQVMASVTLPACHLTWTTLAGIGKVESDHGTTGGAKLLPNGKVNPPIIGPALDGTGGRPLVRDTDLGRLDGDTTYDRAIGPMQFLPSTWETYQADGDGDGITDPGDLNDAALAAADYLCAHNRDLTKPADWWAAVLSYNEVQAYAQNVYAAADNYGKLSRTAPAG